MSVANCPSCGAQVEFAIGSSAVVVCNHCRSVVARTDRAVEDLGKVAALVDTGSPLRVGLAGKYRGQGFRITGRTQLRHQAGGVWDEWYAAFDDATWGWLAEAQGKYYLTFQVAAEAPPYDQLDLGVSVPALAPLVVNELGVAELASAEGEIPWRPIPGSRYEYADLSGPERRFATIDYSEERPIVFKGRQIDFSDLSLEAVELRSARVASARLNCTNCGGALELHAPDQAERIWCPYCGAGHDISEGQLKFFAMLKKNKVEPVIPLGATGTIDGDAYVIAGFLQRSVRFDREYYWTEYLLYNRSKGFRWLVHSDDHWSFVEPIEAGWVADYAPRGAAKTIVRDGRSYRLFQSAVAKVTYVLGEFYWRVEVGEQVDAVDWIAPPHGISKEITKQGAREISYSHARYMTPDEVETAFNVRNLARPTAVGPMQPFIGSDLTKPWAIMVALILLIALVVGATRLRRTILDQSFELTPVPGTDEPARIFFTPTFELSGGRNLMIDAYANVQNSWAYVAGDVVNESTSTTESFELELERYSGYEDGSSWSEGTNARSVYISAPPKGRYALRLEAHWEKGKAPSALRVVVMEGVFRWSHFIAALVAVSLLALPALVRKITWERRRWEDSAYSPYGQSS